MKRNCLTEQPVVKSHITDFSVVDLFCGVGGLTNGFVSAGFKNIVGVDLDETCRYAYEFNNKASFVHADVSQLSSSELNKLFTPGKRKILVGCAPCQPYSIFNRYKKENISQALDPRWGLLYSFSELIGKIKPEIVSMENVPLLQKFKGGVLLRDFISKLEARGYAVTCEVVNAQNFSVPQRRSRLVLLASLHGEIEIPSSDGSSKTRSVRDSIGDLPKLGAGEISSVDPLHRARKLTALSKTRIQATPEGGSWKDWHDDLKLECHKRPGGSKYGSVYGRMSWDDVSPTITTYCMGINNGRFGHPAQDRAISLREAAILQSFPNDYAFVDPESRFNVGNTAKHIGNAVPPKLGKAIAEKIKFHLGLR